MHPHANRAHTKTQDSCRPHLQDGGLIGMRKPTRVVGQDESLSRPPSKDKPAPVDDDAVDATRRVCRRATDRPIDQGSHSDTAQKQSDQCDATQHALGSDGPANVHLPYLQRLMSRCITHIHPRKLFKVDASRNISNQRKQPIQ